MWANRQVGARQRVETARLVLETESAKLPQAESAFRVAQERLNEIRRHAMQAGSRLQLEQANLSHAERSRQTLEQREVRLGAELETLDPPDAQALLDHEARIAELELRIEAAQVESSPAPLAVSRASPPAGE